MNNAVLTLCLPALLGLVVGSFLNVLIHRLPRMMQAQWEAEASLMSNPAAPSNLPTYNLAWPGSHCPQCQHDLRWFDNIPALSYLLLKGRCRYCSARIGWRYLGVECLTGILFAWAFMHHGFGVEALAWCGFSAALVALAAIDADTTLLPDAITQPLLWSGLLMSSLSWTGISLSMSLWGACAGYLLLWLVLHLFKWITGKEGMGQGDLKLLAALGAWLGWPALLSLVLISSITGALVGIWLKSRQKLSPEGYLPFGPFLVFAGLWVMMFGSLPPFQI